VTSRPPDVELVPSGGDDEIAAVRAALAAARVSLAAEPSGYASPWRAAALADAVERQPAATSDGPSAH
jgi:hypothetical protein